MDKETIEIIAFIVLLLVTIIIPVNNR